VGFLEINLWGGSLLFNQGDVNLKFAVNPENSPILVGVKDPTTPIKTTDQGLWLGGKTAIKRQILVKFWA
jgi:hypothetical protein